MSIGKACADTRGESWNVLTSPWLDLMTTEAIPVQHSPLSALRQSTNLNCITHASPLDLFAAHRFLLTLLYWKCDCVGGVTELRNSLLRGQAPDALIQSIEAESPHFELFDSLEPFLQDPSAGKEKKNYSAGSLFAEYATGTDIAHFHHGDDTNMRLCLKCATIGLMRVVPWSQSGGQGISPSVHNAPPIMALAFGDNLAETLGLNLVPLAAPMGKPVWTGHFVPTNPSGSIPILEALTWNPRRIFLPAPQPIEFCWRCGVSNIMGVGPIKYLKNSDTRGLKEGTKKLPFAWQDPSAFYGADAPFKPMKSTNELWTTNNNDLNILADGKRPSTSEVLRANPDHREWRLFIPCTNPANNKTYDHRQIGLSTFESASIQSMISPVQRSAVRLGLDGWKEPPRSSRFDGCRKFVQTSVRFLSVEDWTVLANAAYCDMHKAPAAFEVLSGLLWSLRDKTKGLPGRKAAWLILKLMASAPSPARQLTASSSFCPLRDLFPRRQLGALRNGLYSESLYPVSMPQGHDLERRLQEIIHQVNRGREPVKVDWVDLCHCLDYLLD